GAFRPLGEEQSRSEKSHPGGKGFRELFPRAHHSRRVLGLGLPGQGWCRREHSGSTGVDRQECQQNWCGPTNYLGRHSHAAIEVNLSLSETYALKYWWCSPPRTGIASVRPTVLSVTTALRTAARCAPFARRAIT